MKILIVNKFWYARGGDCIVAMNTALLLRRMGHEVRVFSMQHPCNVACTGSQDYFVSQVHFDGSFMGKLRALRRTMGDKEVRNSFTSLLKDFRPDVVHLHNIHSYLSPSVAVIAREFGCRVVWTLHDYKLFCSSYSCVCNGEPCDRCIEHPADVVINRCMKQSLLASVAALLETTHWNINKMLQCVDMFICPSLFMAQEMEKAGVPCDKLTVIPNYLVEERRDSSPVVTGRGDYCCYVGRLSPEKGVDTLLKAVATLPLKLKVAGDGPLLDPLKSDYSSFANIEFLGRLTGNDVNGLLRLARFSVVPSSWWENNPLSVIESLSAGTPVVGTRMGGIPELIDDRNGLLVPSGDVNSLVDALNQAWDARWDHAAIARRAALRFSPAAYYRSIMRVYNHQ